MRRLLHLLKNRNDTAVRPEENETQEHKNQHDAHPLRYSKPDARIRRHQRIPESTGLHAVERHCSLMHRPYPPLTRIMDTHKIATLNINGLSYPTWVAMLEAFIRLHDLEIILLHVSQQIFTHIPGYTPQNIGTTRCGMAIITRELLTLNHTTQLPSGRAIAAL
jgi:hypothetical protein